MSTAQIKEQYQEEQIARAYDRERFRSLAGRTFDRLEKRALRRAMADVRRAVPQPRVLDVPCGTGRITELWLREGLHVLGGDISQAMINVAREKCGAFASQATFRPLDLDRLDVPDGSFDLVSCIRLFHHLRTAERAAVLKELARASARFVIVNVSFSSPVYRLRRRAKRFLGQGVSKTSSTWTEIQAEAQLSGLELRGVRMVFPWLSEDMVLLLEKVH